MILQTMSSSTQDEKTLLLLDEISQARKGLQAQKITDTLLGQWRTMVRDAGQTIDVGKLDRYTESKTPTQQRSYFVGTQTEPDLSQEQVCRYIEANLAVKERFLLDWQKGSFLLNVDSFREWLVQLHKLQAYKSEGGIIRLGAGKGSRRHTWIILGEVIPLAKQYKDPYSLDEGLYITPLQQMPSHHCPYDILGPSEDIYVYQFYPKAESFDLYLEIIWQQLCLLHEEFTITSMARFLQYATCLHLMKTSNHVFHMNMINCLLELSGFWGLEHGLIDFVALRFSEENFYSYFANEIKKSHS